MPTELGRGAGTLLWFLLGLSALSAAPGRVLYQESFEHYGPRPPGCGAACTVGEYPPSLKFLEFRPSQPEAVFLDFAKGEPAGWQNYQLEFQFRFPGGSKKSFELRLRCGREELHGLRVGPEGADPAHGDVSTSAGPPRRNVISASGRFPLLGDIWYRGVVTAQGQNMEFFLEDSGLLRRLGALQTSGAPGTGFNFFSDTAVDFTGLVVRELDGAGEVRSESQRADPLAESVTLLDADTERRIAFAEGIGQGSASLRLGQSRQPLLIGLVWGDGAETTLSVKASGEVRARKVVRDGKPDQEKLELPDACLEFQEVPRAKLDRPPWKLKAHIRPNFSYLEQGAITDQRGFAANWTKIPGASEHFFRFAVRPDPQGAEMWLDGRYIGRFDRPTRLKALTLRLPAGSACKTISTEPAAGSSLFLPLDVSPLANPGRMGAARLSLGAGPCRVGTIPFQVARASDNLDLGVVRENLGSFYLECDGYLSRSAFSGLPESLMLSVPARQYIRAWLLCAVEDDPAKDPVVTARLTRFSAGDLAGRGPAIADTTVVLPRPGQAAGPGQVEVGQVTLQGGNRRSSVPLYLVEVPLQAGEIQDVIFQEQSFRMIPQPYLDFELLGKLDVVRQQLDKSHKPDPRSVSGVHVFGVTLERSPVEMQITPGVTGNLYRAGEKAEMRVTLRPAEPNRGELRWTIHDAEERRVGVGSAGWDLLQAGGERNLSVPLTPGALGWYSVTFALLDSQGRLMLEHRASFGLLDNDTRQTAYASPYFSWWHGGAHGTGTLEVAGPLLQRLGLHRTLLQSEAQGAPWKLTLGQIGSQHVNPNLADDDNKKKLVTAIGDLRQRFPHVNSADIFHETYNGPFPIELLDQPSPVVPEKQEIRERKLLRNAELLCRVYREHFPDVRLVLGNCGDSLGTMAMFFRHKFPKALMDAMGEESVGQTMPPEKSTALGNWMLRELARRFDYELPVEACYEWKCRNVRDFGPRRAAEWVVRDALIGLAWGQQLVPVAGLIEPANSYYNTVWGNSYLFSRSPQLYPYPSAVAVGTLSQVLDAAALQRSLPTGSLTVYALEFKRGLDWLYAFWTARGQAELTLHFDRDTALRSIGLYGAVQETRTDGRKLALRAAGAVTYLRTPEPVRGVALGRRSYPDDTPPAYAAVTVANPMDRAAGWTLASQPDPRLENPAEHGRYPPFRKLGRYALRQVKDDEKGDCLELELLKDGPSPALMQEYVVARLPTPAVLPGRPHTVGLWVKGNSGWGQLMWEFEDAEGEKWLSCGTGGYGCDVYDWPAQAALNFDGWNFIQFPIRQDSPVKLPNPGEVANQWQSSGGNRRFDYPLKLTALVVTMTRQALDLTEMKPVTTVLRCQNLSAYGD